MQSAQQKVFTVSEFTTNLKSILETQITPCWIKGEVSNLRKQSSGHVYFTLKDFASQISCVLFRADALRQLAPIEEGKLLLVFGEISVFEPRGNYQLLVRIILEEGKGQLQAAFHKLKETLAAEGLFDKEKKKPIPALPQTIGIITSPTGAAIQDFMSILKRRNWSGHLIILPAKVQGEGSIEDIVSQIKNAQNLNVFDLLVLARGGGSLEDLWSFNDARVVRALAQCTIPTISAIGHEIDFTLSDFAADFRAETPSAAAEIITSHFIDYTVRIIKAQRMLVDVFDSYVVSVNYKLEKLSQCLTNIFPEKVLETSYLKLDDLSSRLKTIVREGHFHARESLSHVRSRLSHVSPEGIARLERERLHQFNRRFSNLSLETSLKRGFVLLKDRNGKFVQRKKDVKVGHELRAIFSDGEVAATIIDVLKI